MHVLSETQTTWNLSVPTVCTLIHRVFIFSLQNLKIKLKEKKKKPFPNSISQVFFSFVLKTKQKATDSILTSNTDEFPN